MNKVAMFLKVFIFAFAVLSSFTVKAEQSHVGTTDYGIEATLPFENLALEAKVNAAELSSRQYKSNTVSAVKNTDPENEVSIDVIPGKNYILAGFQNAKSTSFLYISIFSNYFENHNYQRGPPLHKMA